MNRNGFPKRILLSKYNSCTIFQFNDDVIRFQTSTRLERYIKVVEWDHGYLVVIAKYSSVGEVEEYIDLIPILEQLYYDVDQFLKPIREVKIDYSPEI